MADSDHSEHKFRYLLKPGNDFKLVQKMRLWCVISFLLCAASIGMLFVNKEVRGAHLNWTIDFKGGTEVVYAFADKADPTRYVKVDAGTVRGALDKAGDSTADVSEYEYVDQQKRTITGITVKTPRFGALTKEQETAATDAILARFADRGVQKVSWSGDRVFVRSTQLVPEPEVKEVLGAAGLELKPVDPDQAKINVVPNEDTGEYNATFTVWGLDRQYELALEAAMPEVDAQIVEAHGVGAKAGDKLRNDGIKSLFYAMVLIVLYLAFRFDIRYAPGAIIATFHDAIMVIGVFAVTYTEVSLTSVAALLTVVGFSVNDTVVIFDRIRENMAKHKDKKVERVVDISLNEVLVRSLLTSVTLFVVTLAMNIFGTGLVKNFAFAMNAGIIVGAYSSIFLAPPVFIWIHRRYYMGPAAKARRVTPAPQASES